MFTYGDGVADIDIRCPTTVSQFPRETGHCDLGAFPVTVRQDYSSKEIEVTEFQEKPEKSEGWINGGFFVLNRKVIDFINGDETIWERDIVENLARKLVKWMGYRHYGFWSCMDTMRERNFLEEPWRSGSAPWKRICSLSSLDLS